MHIVLFTHPAFLAHQSMPRFARLIADGMRARGHAVEVRTAQARLARLPGPKKLVKWLGYLDQYVVFPREIRRQLPHDPPGTLFVFADHALGPWVPLVAGRPHVIHCHDFLAQRAALGEIPECPTGWSGRRYQAYIRRGYARGSYFISVSHTTRADLHRFLPTRPAGSEVVYNGVHPAFVPRNVAQARARVGQELGLDLGRGYLLHVGGNQWYKNRMGVLELYAAWRAAGGAGLPLLVVGEAPTPAQLRWWQQSAFKGDVTFSSGLSDELVGLAYAGATALLFPSLAEGFGWPIAEALAAGCPVITTGEAPMTEVGGTAAFYLPRRPAADTGSWATAGASVITQVVGLDPVARKAVVEAGLLNAGRFEATAALNQLEALYEGILAAANPTPISTG